MFTFDLLRGRFNGHKIMETVKYGAGSSIASLLISIPVDTYFWGL